MSFYETTTPDLSEEVETVEAIAQPFELSVEADEDDTDDTDDTVAHDAVARPVKETRRALDKATVRRITVKTTDLAAAPTHLRALLAVAFGVPDTVADLTVAVFTGNRDGLLSLTDTLALSEPADPIDTMISAIALGRVRMKGVWSVLSNFGLLSGPVPVVEVKAGGAIAKAAGSVPQANLDEISAVVALAKK